MRTFNMAYLVVSIFIFSLIELSGCWSPGTASPGVARLEPKGIPDLDWTILENDYDATMFQVYAMEFGNVRIRLLGFCPQILTYCEDRLNGCTLVTLDVDARAHTRLYLLDCEEGVYAAEITAVNVTVQEDHCFSQEEIASLFSDRRAEIFTRIDSDFTYVEERFYHHARGKGIRFSDTYKVIRTTEARLDDKGSWIVMEHGQGQ